MEEDWGAKGNDKQQLMEETLLAFGYIEVTELLAGTNMETVGRWSVN